MKGLHVQHIAFGVGFGVSLTACASTNGARETPAYHHGFEHAERWAKEFDDPSRDSWHQSRVPSV